MKLPFSIRKWFRVSTVSIFDNDLLYIYIGPIYIMIWKYRKYQPFSVEMHVDNEVMDW